MNCTYSQIGLDERRKIVRWRTATSVLLSQQYAIPTSIKGRLVI